MMKFQEVLQHFYFAALLKKASVEISDKSLLHKKWNKIFLSEKGLISFFDGEQICWKNLFNFLFAYSPCINTNRFLLAT